MSNSIEGFNLRLVERMAELGMTQADLCRVTGFASSMISHYCTGQRIPAVPAAVSIAKALKTTVEYLVFGGPAQKKEASDGSLLVKENEMQYTTNSLVGSLNEEGQAKVLAYIEDLISTGKY